MPWVAHGNGSTPPPLRAGSRGVGEQVKVRRAAGLLFFFDDGRTLDIAQLLTGTLASVPHTRVYAMSPARGEEHRVSRDELELLLAVPANDWTATDALATDLAPTLVERGLLVADGDENDERLRSSGWNRHAAAYHFLTRWRDVDIRNGDGEVIAANEADIRAFLELRGPAPPAFRPVEAPSRVVDLPKVRPDGDLYSVLARRRTTRGFDESRPLPLEELALVLDQVFGCHGHVTAAGGGLEMLKRTSPSAGGLHPIEAFPLVLNVAGVDAGIHQYDASRHMLELIEPIEPDSVKAVAARFVCGQTYFATAHVLLLLVARFERSYWKYRDHPKAYASILLDAGHLSQTLYLVATERGLGAFVTTVVNNAEIDERLGLDGVDEGTVAVCGVGVPGATTPFDPEFRPFTRG
jgi:putative peptide maturation dehydrogenase